MSKDNFKFFKNIIEAIIFSSSEPVKTELLEKKVPASISLIDLLNELKDYKYNKHRVRANKEIGKLFSSKFKNINRSLLIR